MLAQGSGLRAFNLSAHGVSGCRRVAAVDPSLADEMQREVARLRQREKAAKSKQSQQFRNFFGRDEAK